MLEFLLITLIVLACLPFIPWASLSRKKKSLLDPSVDPYIMPPGKKKD
ncbi:hypothetical protein [Chitinibacter sp. S2-10]